MEKKPKIEKKPTLKYEKPLVVDLAPKQASGAPVCFPLGSQDYNNNDQVPD